MNNEKNEVNFDETIFQDMVEKMKDGVTTIAEIRGVPYEDLEGLYQIGSTYYNAGMDEGKNYDYDVTIEPTEKGCKLVANGEDVCFLEFGAGVSTKSWQGEGQEGLPPIYPGSWSETEGVGQFANQGYWIYGNELYKGIEPTMGMYHASKQMLTDCIEEARKVFEK